MSPLLPAMEVPELNTSLPLVPATPAFAVVMTTLPLLLAVPSPETNKIKPPVAPVLRPAATDTSPPSPLVPLPTTRLTLPPRPAVAAPVPTRIAPLVPAVAAPELKTKAPLAPAAPPLLLAMRMEPLLDAVPSPLVILTDPPVFALLRPACT